MIWFFTSPPFKDDDVSEDYYDFYDNFFKEAMRICNKTCIIINSATRLNELIVRYPPKRLLVWGKGVSKYSWRYNLILVYEKNDYKVNPKIWSDAFGIQPIIGRRKCHKYQDPTLLYKTIISMFDDCISVIDPFMGSGTTGMACRLLNKDFVGIEKNKEIFTVAVKRISNYQKRLDDEWLLIL